MTKEHNTNTPTGQAKGEPRRSPRERTGGDTKVQFWEPAKQTCAKGTGRSIGLNVLLITDCEKLITGRRGMGPWSLNIAEAIFDVAAPRIIARANARHKNPSEALMRWADRWVPELVEAEGSTWVHRRFLEIREERFGSFRTVDQIAQDLGTVQDEVLGYRLEAMVSLDRPPAVRKKERAQADAEYQAAKRVANGAIPQDMKIAARHARGEFGDKPLKTVRRHIKEGKMIDPNRMPDMAPDGHISSDGHFSSATVLTCRVEDEKCPRQFLAETTPSLEIDQIEREPLDTNGPDTFCPLSNDEDAMPKDETKTDRETLNLTEHFRVVVRIVSPVRAQPLPVIQAKIVSMMMAA